jgi:LPXTG-motif cell wall-anchored protein
MNGPGDLVLSLLMLAGVLLGAGGIWLLIKRRDRKRALLMLAVALVMFGNVAVWMLPLG